MNSLSFNNQILLIKLANTLDYVPFGSTLSNIIVLIVKGFLNKKSDHRTFFQSFFNFFNPVRPTNQAHKFTKCKSSFV